MSTPPRLPDTLRVLERGWLSANNVLLFDGDEATLVDSGYVTHAEQTVALLHAALEGRHLGSLINTHSHSDHIGGNAAVQRAFGCSITVPKGVAPAVESWDEAALLLSVIDQAGEPFKADATLDAGDRFVAGELEWQAIATPGHDMDALAYYNAERRILMSGDALWRDGFGILFGHVLGTGDALGEARRTLETIGRLAVDVVLPGHGAPFAEFDDALERAFARLRAFEADGARMARNAIRACITFRLLDVRSMALDELPRHLDETPLYRAANQRFLGLDPDALAAWLVKELERAGVARREHGALVAS
ncbi:MBL fold metallo-hydrolase [Thauera sp. Sel9]|uniref:MBL fold metallo-hydrolase n=1 Tax=Thauera sp. Sel9 TaxID=2974299 RepID=UPI0021E1A288|nr:MBL fold metallo-hydrolase [Thauera sp. Sel9]MCV2218686.1 MBL fold metallo-hydrolase [Thauera sp. Sel9]